MIELIELTQSKVQLTISRLYSFQNKFQRLPRFSQESQENESQKSINSLQRMNLRNAKSKSIIKQHQYIKIKDSDYDDSSIKFPEFRNLAQNNALIGNFKHVINCQKDYFSQQRKLSKSVKRLRPQAALFTNKTKLKVKI